MTSVMPHAAISGSAQTIVTLDEEGVQGAIQTIARLPDYDAVHHTVALEIKGLRLCLLGKSSAQDEWNHIEVGGAKASGRDVTVHLNRHANKAQPFADHPACLFVVEGAQR